MWEVPTSDINDTGSWKSSRCYLQFLIIHISARTKTKSKTIYCRFSVKALQWLGGNSSKNLFYWTVPLSFTVLIITLFPVDYRTFFQLIITLSSSWLSLFLPVDYHSFFQLIITLFSSWLSLFLLESGKRNICSRLREGKICPILSPTQE